AQRLRAVVEAAPVTIDPRARCLMRRVRSAGREIEEEWLLGRRLVQVLHGANRLVGEVLGQMVAVLGRARRLDEPVVAHQLRGPLVGVAVQEAVVALEAEAERPALERTGRALLPARRQVPLADRDRGVARVPQESWQRARRARDAAVVTGEADGDVGEESHAAGLVV